MSTNVTRAPKRRIEKRRNRINLTIGSSSAHIVLHDAEDSKTLVRTIVKLYILYAGAAGSVNDWHILIQRAEASVEIMAPIVTQALDQESPLALIWEESGNHFNKTSVGQYIPVVVQADLKGMRKLKKGDTISFSHVAGEDAVVTVTGHITLFFKE